jgi:hypothetical protein
MRPFAVLAAVGAGIGLLIPMQAQSFTNGTLVGGQVKSALAYGSGTSWCLVDNGNTQFQINQAGSKAVISFAEVIYFDGSTLLFFRWTDDIDILWPNGRHYTLQTNANLP